MPTKYVSHLENDYISSSVEMGGDVVIVVPSIDHHLVPAITQSHSHHICIDAEVDVEPNSPKTITESSSKFCYFKYKTNNNNNHFAM